MIRENCSSKVKMPSSMFFLNTKKTLSACHLELCTIYEHPFKELAIINISVLNNITFQ